MQSVLWTTLHVLWSLLHPFVWTSGPQCRIVKPIHAESIAWTWRAPKEANSCYGNTVAQRSLVGAGLLSYQINSRTSSICKAWSWDEKCRISWKNCLSMNQSDQNFFIFADSKAKSDLPKSNGKKNQTNITSELGAFFQSDNPTDLRHNETPWLHPSLAELVMIWRWHLKNLEATDLNLGEANDEENDEIFRASWMSCFFPFIRANFLHILFQIYLLVI